MTAEEINASNCNHLVHHDSQSHHTTHLLEVKVMVRGDEGPEDHDGHAENHKDRCRLLEEPPVSRHDNNVGQILEHRYLKSHTDRFGYNIRTTAR